MTFLDVCIFTKGVNIFLMGPFFTIDNGVTAKTIKIRQSFSCRHVSHGWLVVDMAFSTAVITCCNSINRRNSSAGPVVCHESCSG